MAAFCRVYGISDPWGARVQVQIECGTTIIGITVASATFFVVLFNFVFCGYFYVSIFCLLVC